MKHSFTIFFLLLFIFSKSQQSHLQGNWILDKILYHNGNSLEINHPLFSTFIEYDFNGNILEINNEKFKVIIDDSTIRTDYRRLNYKFENAYLIISEVGDDKNYYFLKKNDFISKHPEFEPKETIFENRSVLVTNPLIQPEFHHRENFEEFIRKNIPSYSSTAATNNYFNSSFILTKENKITDIQILQGISKKFDGDYKNALLNSEKLLKNPYGKDLLITQTFNFFKLSAALTNNDERQFSDITKKGYESFANNEFPTAITHYEKLLTMNLEPETLDRFKFRISQAYIYLGISYLALGENSNACESFRKVGDKTNFRVRNYLITFYE
ncbi:MAG: hypothetical protein Q4F57_06670 [Weeksellaceae bacterium]|nr:hypothetical protein [Weeksellaceae bacterium]